jgi:hypothetical protein
VTVQNVFLRAGTGLLTNGTPIQVLAKPIEFGADPNRRVATRSRKGKAYTRRLGNAFGSPRRGGKVAYPAAKDSIPRFAALWIQTARRTVHEAIEKVTRG